VVDWSIDKRAELEAALAQGKTGAVLVKYTCPRVEVLPGCGANFGYTYEAVSLKEEVLRVTDEDTLRAQLPLLAGGPLLPKIEAALGRGSALDLGLALSGRLRATEPALFRPDLAAHCRAATHYVSSASLGAFAMSVGTRAKVRTTAEIFASVDASSASTRELTVRDGDLAACRAPSTTPGAMPEGCRAPLRIELRPVDPRVAVRARCEDRNDEQACLSWASLVMNATPGGPTDAGGDVADGPAVGTRLMALCRRGNRDACRAARGLANLRLATLGIQEVDEISCQYGDAGACTEHAARLEDAGKTKEAFETLEHACRIERMKGGSNVACVTFGQRVASGFGPEPREGRPQLALDAFAAACVGGAPGACAQIGPLLRKGLRPRGDLPAGLRLTALCEKDGFACQAASAAHAYGLGVPRDVARARKAWDRHCAEVKKLGELSCRPFPYGDDGTK